MICEFSFSSSHPKLNLIALEKTFNKIKAIYDIALAFLFMLVNEAYNTLSDISMFEISIAILDL